ncbi:uncharacterized protein PRCAT00006328001 [Priceomyces carsonii]|uniref:uncharacterized protein n=1 Tax=Priceomyces carsonii TaxID=28549 RepID=UPI002ED97095|nr:unnamed protein product [Priceomyces carsonii]
MGVPALFRWLSKKYPKIITPVIEENTKEEIGTPQYSDPNPNGEVDNLYLDMNGIVHPCSHPENKPAPETEDEMLLDIFKYTDRVLMMARPRKVLIIAVDGVAPRAKMNQQRARRFRSAQDAKISHEEKERQIKERELRGEVIDDAIKGKKSWDSNAITPGTPFMDKLAAALRYWVAYKLSSDPGWANLQIVISDASVPGEGEHKLMNFIRLQRLDPEYNPNTKHCIYGLDADLIFLGLATHEPHFRVLREDVFANQSRQLKVSDQILMTQEQKDALVEKDGQKPFLWLHVNVLREYLEVELFNPHLPFPFDLERAIDDWIFMCFFVGNDFLPHLPSLDVRDNGIDILVNCWKRILPKLKGYITCDGNLNLDGVEKLLASLAYKEDDIFRRRHEFEKRREDNDKRRKVAQEEEKALKAQYMQQVSKGSDKAPLTADTNMPLFTTSGESVDGFATLTNKEIVANRDIITKANMSNADAAASLKALLDSKKSDNISAAEAVQLSQENQGENKNQVVDTQAEREKKRTIEEVSESNSPTPDADSDKVRMWEPGYRKRYYQTKFHAVTPDQINEARRDVVKSYLEGISWVLLYYYQGCPSWQWYYPYHYSPFAADFVDIANIVGEEGITFKLGQPFRPYEQLMSVLPAASGHNLPEVFRGLMSDPSSEIIDFYPEDFQIDMNGKKMSWQGIALLPFIDEDRLLKAVQAQYPLLSEYEEDRNTLKHDVLFISNENKNYRKFNEHLYGEVTTQVVSFRSSKTGLAGTASSIENFKGNAKMIFPLKQGNMPDIQNSDYLQVTYKMPPKKHGKSMLLNGYIPHVKALTQEDKDGILYGQGRNAGSRFRTPNDNSSYINTGPCGKELYLTYSMRFGGYRSFLQMTKQNNHGFEMRSNFNKASYRQNTYNGKQTGYQNNYNNHKFNNSNRGPPNQQYNHYKRGYNNNFKGSVGNQGRYNHGYNNDSYNNYNNNYNSNYNNSYNQTHHNNYNNSYSNRQSTFNNAQHTNNRFNDGGHQQDHQRFPNNNRGPGNSSQGYNGYRR